MSHEATKKTALRLADFVGTNSDDPAFQVKPNESLPSLICTNLFNPQDFIPKLRRHLFLRLSGEDYHDDERIITPEEDQSLIIINDTIHRHKILRVNYTTYDTRREQDSINARTHPDIMLPSRDSNHDIHPYWYARVCGVFHAKAYLHSTTDLTQRPSSVPQIVEFVWVRWFGLHYAHRSGWKAKALPKVGFVNPLIDKSLAFDFIDPVDIIRAIHLIPSFNDGTSPNGLGPTVVRPESDQDQDFNFFYVNM